ncbi:MAG: sigma 54-interacting transcriptional regulator [Planctomycetota bacterium]|nr:sigma 54-interacting transcriptional regulator [Planctomycetota bacterium]
MRTVHPTAENHLSAPAGRPPEDILLEGFEQADRPVTEHVLDYLLEQTGAERILLAIAHADESPRLIARQAGKKALPGEALHPPGETPRLLQGDKPKAASPSASPDGQPAGQPCWQLALSLHAGSTTEAELFLDAPRRPLTAWLDTSSKKSSALLSISLLLDELRERRALQEPRQPAAYPGPPTCEKGFRQELHRVFPEIIGRSRAMEAVLRTTLRIADSDIPILIQGESGTGKELVAAAIHRLSRRSKKPFVCENCGAIAEQLAEAELFGHEKGAFTGAAIARPGLVELAAGGTLFLDEVSEMEPGLQKKLLRVLQEKSVRRVGGTAPTTVDFRLVSATNRNLESMVKEKTFREDLYYRLNVATIQLPALRERREDIPLLMEHFARRYSRKGRKEAPSFSPESIEALNAYDWPGNIRELGNEIWRLVETVDGEIKPGDLSAKILSSRDCPGGRKQGLLKDMEREVLGGAIADALVKTHGNRAQAARLLGIGRATLYRRLERYGLLCS